MSIKKEDIHRNKFTQVGKIFSNTEKNKQKF